MSKTKTNQQPAKPYKNTAFIREAATMEQAEQAWSEILIQGSLFEEMPFDLSNQKEKKIEIDAITDTGQERRKEKTKEKGREVREVVDVQKTSKVDSRPPARPARIEVEPGPALPESIKPEQETDVELETEAEKKHLKESSCLKAVNDLNPVQQAQARQERGLFHRLRQSRLARFFLALQAAILLAPVLYVQAEGSNTAQIDTFITFACDWLAKIGGVVALVGGVIFALGWQREDAEGKSRGLMAIMSGFMLVAISQSRTIFGL